MAKHIKTITYEVFVKMTKKHIFFIENNLQKVGQSLFHLSRRTTMIIQDLLVRRQFSLIPYNRTNVNVKAWWVPGFSDIGRTREGTRYRIPFALYAKKFCISRVCEWVTLNVFTMYRKKYIHQYMKPCLSNNPKYTFHTLKSSLTLAYYLH